MKIEVQSIRTLTVITKLLSPLMEWDAVWVETVELQNPAAEHLVKKSLTGEKLSTISQYQAVLNDALLAKMECAG